MVVKFSVLADSYMGAIDELVGHDESTGSELRLETADCARRDHPSYPMERTAQRFAR